MGGSWTRLMCRPIFNLPDTLSVFKFAIDFSKRKFLFFFKIKLIRNFQCSLYKLCYWIFESTHFRLGFEPYYSAHLYTISFTLQYAVALFLDYFPASLFHYLHLSWVLHAVDRYLVRTREGALTGKIGPTRALLRIFRSIGLMIL